MSLSLRTSGLLAVFTMLGALLLPGTASAGVATSGAVLLDPFDPVPEIQFHHFGGYGGCNSGCGGYEGAGYDRCGKGCGYNRCDDGCYRRRHHHYRHCDDVCGDRYADDDRDGDRDHHDRDGDGYHDGHDGGPDANRPPCIDAHCYDAEHYEHRWRNGDRVGQEWMDRGRRERTIPDEDRAHRFYGHGDQEWHDEDGDAPPPPPPPPPGPPHH